MKTILSLIISAVLIVSGFGQTRNVLVGTNNVVVQPTNFWSADVTNARSGLGLGSAATNAASAFQPASSILSNLVSGGALTFSNITIGITNVTGLQTSLDGKLGTNPTLLIANISNLQTTLDGKLGTNPTLQISNIAALQTALDGKLSGSFPIAISNVSGLQTSLDGKLATNPTLAIANITGLQTNLDSKLSLTGNAVNLTNFPSSLLRTDGSAASLTNFPSSLLRTTGDASGLTNFPTLNQNTTGTASNVTGIVAITNGGSGANTASGARTALGLGTAATNPASAFQPSSAILTNLSSSNGGGLTNIAASSVVGTVALASNVTGSIALASNVTGVVALVNGGTGATNATGARTALGVGSSDVFVGLTNLGTGTGQGFASTPYILGSTNSTTPNNAVLALDSSGVRSVAGLTLAALTNTDNAAFRTAIGLNTAATNPATAFQPSSSVLTNLAASNGGGLTNITASNVTGTIAISNGGSGATTAGGARTNLGLILPALTNTNVTNFRTAIELGATNSVTFNSVQFGNDTTNDVVTVVDKQGLFLESDQTNTGTAAINFQGDASSKMAANTRANLGLGWSALTNSNAGTGLVSVNTNGEVVSPTNFWQVAPISTTVQYQTNVVSTSTNAATNSRNLFLYSLATSVSGITNTITLPTNPATTFEGDRATIIHGASTTNAVTAVRQLGAATNIITLNQYEEAVLFIYRSGAWGLADNISYVEPIYFSGTNAAANAATSRTNLGLGATWLTNTNVTNFRTAIGLGSANAVSFSTVAAQEIYDSVGNKVIDLENFILGVGTTAALEWATNQVQVNVPILFNGTNSASATRTNLGLPLPALTNTNNANFRNAIELGATNNVSFSNVTASGTLTATGTVTATTNLVVNGFVDFSTNHTNSNPATNNQINDFIEIRVGTNQFWLPVYK
jgi:hypothetical protein